MALNFPTAPVVGESYTFGTYTYQWDGVKWTSQNQSVALEPLVQPRQLGDGTKTEFSVPQGYSSSAASYLVVVNGEVQRPMTDYQKVVNAIVFTVAPVDQAKVDITYYQPIGSNVEVSKVFNTREEASNASNEEAAEVRVLSSGASFRVATQAEYDKFPDTGRFTDADGALWVVKFSDKIIAEHFEIKPNTGDFVNTAISSLLQFANGVKVELSIGLYKINGSITEGVTVNTRLVGATRPERGHGSIIQPNSSTYALNQDAVDEMVGRLTVFECDGCSFIGEADTPTESLRFTSLKELRNVAAYGINGAKIGVHVGAFNCQVQDIFMSRFEYFGICTRAGGISAFRDIGLDTNGFGMDESGSYTSAPATYGSGCNFKVSANISPEQYHTIVPTNRPTTTYYERIFCVNSNYYTVNKSGLRAFQVHGLLSGAMQDVGGYSGAYFNVAAVNISGCHFENYAKHGFVNNDNTPRAIACIDSSLVLTARYTVNLGNSAIDPLLEDKFTANDSGLITLAPRLEKVSIVKDAVIDTAKPIKNTVALGVTSDGGNTTTHTFTGALNFTDKFDETSGFNGVVSVHVGKGGNYFDSSSALFHVVAVVGSGNTIRSQSARLSSLTQLVPPWSVEISNVEVSATGDVTVTITWGASWGTSTAFGCRVGFNGSGTLSL